MEKHPLHLLYCSGEVMLVVDTLTNITSTDPSLSRVINSFVFAAAEEATFLWELIVFYPYLTRQLGKDHIFCLQQ